ncbi:MAG: hypothetical protein EBT00_14200 [Proteobacteria bacterium]|nr:hypothetical protein [Pseudomonadota bacterium]NBT19899.1 hypothetical protein [Pseudomonadota bacterium]
MNKTSIPLAEGYSALILTEGQLDALAWFLNRREVNDLLNELDPYVNEDLLNDGYLGLKARVNRVQAKIDEQVGVARV